MTMLQTVNLGPMVSSRRLFDLERLLLLVEPPLMDMMEARRVAVPALPGDAAGYRFLSLPEAEAAAVQRRLPGMIVARERHYGRHYIAMNQGFDAYMSSFSTKTRATLRRKLRKFAELSGGQIDIRAYRGPEEIEQFFALALPLSARTYQDRLLDSGLPADADFRRRALMRAKRGDVRAFLLFVQDRPIAYLYLPSDGEEGRRVLRYDYLGYDPDLAYCSPGTVLQLEALSRLMEEDRFAWFDFTSGEGAHKALFGTGKVRCVDFLMLRGGIANRMTVGALETVDRIVDVASGAAERIGAKAAAKRLLRRA